MLSRFILTVGNDVKSIPFRTVFIFEKSQKPRGAKSEMLGGCGQLRTFFRTNTPKSEASDNEMK